MNDETLERLKSTELEILLAVKAVCEKHDITFFLDSGTLLGAARHQGFIPWDDDIDIAMPREDYEKFLQIAQAELGDKYFVQTKETDNYSITPFVKVRKNGTVMLENAGSETPAHHGIWIDVFPLDPIDDADENFSKKRKQWRFWHKLHGLRSVSVATKGTGAAKSLARKFVRLPLFVFSEGFYLRKIEGLREDDAFIPGKALTCFYYYTAFIRLAYEDVFPLKTLPFEGYDMPVISSWEKYLADVYGDWESLPPVEKRVTHDVLKIDFGD